MKELIGIRNDDYGINTTAILNKIKYAVEITFQVEADVDHVTKKYNCTLYKKENGWHIKFQYNENTVIVGLAHLSDVYWNSEAIEYGTENLELGCVLASTINAIYQKNKEIL